MALRSLLMRAFGHPQGPLGRLGGIIMARGNAPFAAWVVDLLDLRPADIVLEVGFGPGVAIELLSRRVSHVAGVDPSREMLAQATARNAGAGNIRLELAYAENLPFADGAFDKALAINSMQLWSDPVAGLRQIHRVLRHGATLALGFTPRSGQTRDGLPELLASAGFAAPRIIEGDLGFCLLALRP